MNLENEPTLIQWPCKLQFEPLPLSSCVNRNCEHFPLLFHYCTLPYGAAIKWSQVFLPARTDDKLCTRTWSIRCKSVTRKHFLATSDGRIPLPKKEAHVAQPCVSAGMTLHCCCTAPTNPPLPISVCFLPQCNHKCIETLPTWELGRFRLNPFHFHSLICKCRLTILAVVTTRPTQSLAETWLRRRRLD